MAALLPPTSRDSLGAASDLLESRVADAGSDELSRTAGDLFAVARLLAGERELRRLLADSSAPTDERASLADRLFAERLSTTAVEVVRSLARSRWSAPPDLVDSVDSLARQAALAAAEKDGSLDDVEDQLFRFGRILEQNAELTGLLGDRGKPADGRIGLLDDVLADRVNPVTAMLLREAVTAVRGPHLVVAAEELATLAAARRDRSVARVTSSVALSEQQEQSLAETLGRMYGRDISVHVEVDPRLLGGLVVRIGGEVIDGSVAGKLAAARRTLPT